MNNQLSRRQWLAGIFGGICGLASALFLPEIPKARATARKTSPRKILVCDRFPAKVWTYTYDGKGRLTSVHDPREGLQVATYSYHGSGRAHSGVTTLTYRSSRKS